MAEWSVGGMVWGALSATYHILRLNELVEWGQSRSSNKSKQTPAREQRKPPPSALSADPEQPGAPTPTAPSAGKGQSSAPAKKTTSQKKQSQSRTWGGGVDATKNTFNAMTGNRLSSGKKAATKQKQVSDSAAANKAVLNALKGDALKAEDRARLNKSGLGRCKVACLDRLEAVKNTDYTQKNFGQGEALVELGIQLALMIYLLLNLLGMAAGPAWKATKIILGVALGGATGLLVAGGLKSGDLVIAARNRLYPGQKGIQIAEGEEELELEALNNLECPDPGLNESEQLEVLQDSEMGAELSRVTDSDLYKQLSAEKDKQVFNQELQEKQIERMKKQLTEGNLPDTQKQVIEREIKLRQSQLSVTRAELGNLNAQMEAMVTPALATVHNQAAQLDGDDFDDLELSPSGVPSPSSGSGVGQSLFSVKEGVRPSQDQMPVSSVPSAPQLRSEEDVAKEVKESAAASRSFTPGRDSAVADSPRNSERQTQQGPSKSGKNGPGNPDVSDAPKRTTPRAGS